LETVKSLFRTPNLLFVAAVLWAAGGVLALAVGDSAVFPLAFSAFWLLVAFWERSRGARRRQGAGGQP
jgi:uncharacterized membrane protein